MVGRPRKPIDQLASSTLKQNPGRYRHLRLVATAAAGDPDMPATLTDEEQEVFAGLVADMNSLGTSSRVYDKVLHMAAREWVAYRKMAPGRDRDKCFDRVLRVLGECGLTPKSLSGVQRTATNEAAKEDVFGRMFRDYYKNFRDG